MWDNTTGGKRLWRYELDSTRSGTPKWRALVKTKTSAFTITQIATRIVYWILRPVKKRTAWENYILCLYSENICIVRTAPSLTPCGTTPAKLWDQHKLSPRQQMADKRHSKSNHYIELCMREKDGEQLEQRRGNRFRWKHTHSSDVEEHTFLSMFLSLPSYLLP